MTEGGPKDPGRTRDRSPKQEGGFVVDIGDAPILMFYSKTVGRRKSAKIQFITDRKKAAHFVTTSLPEQYYDAYAHHVPAMRLTREQPVVLEGDIAAQLANLTISQSEFLKKQEDPTEPTLYGFWKPIPRPTTESGMVMWYDESGYHVSIVRSKKEARSLVKTLDWLSEGHRALFLQNVETWNSPESSRRVSRHITGSVAKLICLASELFTKEREGRGSVN